MTIDVLNATLTAKGLKPNQRINESGLTITQLIQLSTSPAVVRLTVSLPNTNTQWQGAAFRLYGDWYQVAGSFELVTPTLTLIDFLVISIKLVYI